MRYLLAAFVATIISASPAAAQAAGGVPWVTLDARRTLPGQQENYLAFIRANWQVAREEVKRQGHVLDYAVHVVPTDSLAPGGWDVLLVTVYRDSTAAANAEEIFRPVIAAREMIRIDGKGPREMAIGLWVATTRLVEPSPPRESAMMLPSAESVLARAREALGGNRFHLAAARLATSASCEGPRGRYVTRTMSTPQRILFEQDLTYSGDSTRMLVVGDSGWAATTRGGGPALTAGQRQMALLHDFQRMLLRPADLMRFDGTVTRTRFMGREALALGGTIRGDQPAHFYFDPHSGLPLGVEHALHGSTANDDRIRVAVTGWRPQDGGLVVASLTVHHGAGQWQFTYDRVTMNAVPDS